MLMLSSVTSLVKAEEQIIPSLDQFKATLEMFHWCTISSPQITIRLVQRVSCYLGFRKYRSYRTQFASNTNL